MLAMDNSSANANTNANASAGNNSGSNSAKSRKPRRANAKAHHYQHTKDHHQTNSSFATHSTINTSENTRQPSVVDASNSSSGNDIHKHHTSLPSTSTSSNQQLLPFNITPSIHQTLSSSPGGGVVLVQKETTTATTTTTTTNNTVVMQRQPSLPPQSPLPSYNDIICTHIHQYGFLQGMFSDLTIFVRVAGNPNIQGGTTNGDNTTVSFKLHKILAVRSQMLMHLIQDAELNSPGTYPLEITLPIVDPNLTYEGLSVALGHLYGTFSEAALASPNTTSEDRSTRYRSSLAAAVHLHLRDLASSVTQLIKNDISRVTISKYCDFIATADYGSYSGEIRDAVFIYLAKGAIRESFECTDTPINTVKDVIWPLKDSEAYKVLGRTFADLPFEWLKRVVESKDFDVPEDMDRYLFAKEVIQRRAKGPSIHGASSPTAPPIAGEENVLLAFGTGGAKNTSGVTIVRKAPKSGLNQSSTSVGLPRPSSASSERKLWKAGDDM